MQVAADQPLMSAGLDSLSAVELRNSLQARFSVDMPATVTFDYPTVAALAAYISTHLATSAAQQHHNPAASPPRLGAHPQGRLEAELEGIVADVLGAPVPRGQPLMEAGLDSLGE